jgi:hypothetical protein
MISSFDVIRVEDFTSNAFGQGDLTLILQHTSWVCALERTAASLSMRRLSELSTTMMRGPQPAAWYDCSDDQNRS